MAKPRLIKPTSQNAIAKSYQKLLVGYYRDYKKFMKEELLPVISKTNEKVKNDAPKVSNLDHDIYSEIEAATNRAIKKLNSKYPDATLKKWANMIVSRVESGSTKDLERTVNSHPKASIRKDAVREEVPEFRIPATKREMASLYNTVISQNIGLIKSVPIQSSTQLTSLLTSSVMSNKTVASIKKMLETKLDASRSRLELIARDQVLKLNGKTNEFKQQALGVKKYIWRTARDGAVRGRPGGTSPNAKRSHWAREGKTFSWSEPPAGGHPGQDFQCRCYAEPILEDII